MIQHKIQTKNCHISVARVLIKIAAWLLIFFLSCLSHAFLQNRFEHYGAMLFRLTSSTIYIPSKLLEVLEISCINS